MFSLWVFTSHLWTRARRLIVFIIMDCRSTGVKYIPNHFTARPRPPFRFPEGDILLYMDGVLLDVQGWHGYRQLNIGRRHSCSARVLGSASRDGTTAAHGGPRVRFAAIIERSNDAGHDRCMTSPRPVGSDSGAVVCGSRHCFTRRVLAIWLTDVTGRLTLKIGSVPKLTAVRRIIMVLVRLKAQHLRLR